MTDLNTAIETFLEEKNLKTYLRYSGYTPSTVTKLLGSLKEHYQNEVLSSEEISGAMKSTAIAYKRDKGTAISIFRKFLEFLKKEYAFEPDVKFPLIDTSNTFERQMYLAKELQTGEKTIDKLAEELWISSRTIDDDLARLRGNKDPIQVCGKKFIVNETSARDKTMSFASTVHPLFLTFNITQVIATLKGLKHMCDDPGMKQYALLSASAIWQQLSEYAKERIIYVSQKIMPDDIEWYQSLEKEEENLFRTEYECRHTNGAGVILDCIKNEKKCFVEYFSEDGSKVFYENCSIVPGSYEHRSVTILSEEEEHNLQLDRILRSSYTREGLY